MSVAQETYLIYGYKLDKDIPPKCSEDEQGRLGDLSLPHNGVGAQSAIGLLLDGMGGKYWICGKCIYCASEDTCGFPLIDISRGVLTAPQKHKVKVALDEWMFKNDLDEYLVLTPFGKHPIMAQFIVTHYH